MLAPEYATVQKAARIFPIIAGFYYAPVAFTAIPKNIVAKHPAIT